jgi:hypothetical protein
MSGEFVDAAALTFRFILGFAFFAAAVPKLVAAGDFQRAVANYALLPPVLVRPVATWLPRLELLCASALLLGVAITPVAIGVAALLAVFASAVTTNLLRGRTIDCGCAGAVAPRQIGWGLVAGDLLLAGMAIVAAIANPDVLAPDLLAPAASASSLTSQDGLALLLLASTLVLAQLLVSSWLNLRSATRMGRSV